MIPDTPISTLRFALRTANGVILELMKIHRGSRDFTDAVILTTLVQCNSAPLSGRLDLQRAYATFERPVPQSTRRAVSINAVATSLTLPFETVRRRMKALIADGLAEATPHGVTLSDAYLRSDEHRRALDASYTAVRQLYERLGRGRCLPLVDLPPLAEPWGPPEQPPTRIVWRASADYLLRMMELLAPRFESLTRAFVVLEVARANTEGLPDALRGEEGVEPAAFVPDAFRRPVRVSEVAGMLGLPHETVRRNIAEEMGVGRCERVAGGFIVPASVLARPAVLEALTVNFRNVSRMFGELAEAGVLGRWEAETRAA
jgi:hypothetical protein